MGSAGMECTLSAPGVGVWHAEYGEPIEQAILRLCANGETLREALQELWLAVASKPPGSDVASDPKRLFGWLLSIARRRAIDLQRRECHHRHVPLEDSALTPEAVVDEAVWHEAQDRVRHTLDAVATRDATAAHLLRLHYLDELTVAEIARRLNVGARAVSARLQRANQLFAAVWQTTGGGGQGLKRSKGPSKISRHITAARATYLCRHHFTGGSP